MRRQHFERLKPVCPVCRQQLDQLFPLQLVSVLREKGELIIEGMLHCTNPNCLREYPIVDGIPIIVSDIRALVSQQVGTLTQRRDLSPVMESVIGDCCGPGSSFDNTRQQLSSYVWDHYGDLDPAETSENPSPGSVLRVLEAGLDMVEGLTSGPVLDIGCAAGRTTFALAACCKHLVLGIDLNLAMLRVGQDVLQEQRVRYPRRRVGVVYDRREFEVDFACSPRVDFWACDACALPFVPRKFGVVMSLNTLDCVQSPSAFLASLAGSLKHNAKAIIACPYDWSAAATPVENWLGGHSQRGQEGGSSEAILRGMLSGEFGGPIQGLEMVQEKEVDWRVRLHERSVVQYRSQVVFARGTARKDGST